MSHNFLCSCQGGKLSQLNLTCCIDKTILVTQVARDSWLAVNKPWSVYCHKSLALCYNYSINIIFQLIIQAYLVVVGLDTSDEEGVRLLQSFHQGDKRSLQNTRPHQGNSPEIISPSWYHNPMRILSPHDKAHDNQTLSQALH